MLLCGAQNGRRCLEASFPTGQRRRLLVCGRLGAPVVRCKTGSWWTRGPTMRMGEAKRRRARGCSRPFCPNRVSAQPREPTAARAEAMLVPSTSKTGMSDVNGAALRALSHQFASAEADNSR
jgi:hypothetical protein